MDARPGRALIAAGIAGTLLHLGYVMLAPVSFLETRAIVDDTFYYWMIARRFWETGFFTFDGINPTNGFQPLWQWLMLPLGALPQDLQLRLSLLAAAACYQGAAWMLALWPLRDALLRPAFRAAAIMLWVNARFVFEYASSGMEFGLYLLVAAWALMELLRAVESWRGGLDPRLWRLAAACALLPLARVDGLGLAGMLWLAALVAAPRQQRLPVLLWAVSCLVPFALWSLWNQLTFGSALPVSGTVKRLDRLQELGEMGVDPLSPRWWLLGVRDTAMLLAGNTLRFFSGWMPPGPWPRTAAVAAGVAGFLACALWAAGETSLRRDRREALAQWWPAGILLAFALVQAVVYSLAIPRGTQYAQWYYGPAYLGMALAAGVALGHWCRFLPRLAVVWMGVQLACLVTLAQPIQVPSAGAYGALTALEVRTRGRQEVRVGSWNAGIVAFRAPANLRVINLDGLVNSTDFALNHAAGRDVRPFLASQRIEYLLDYTTGADTAEAITAIRLGGDGGGATWSGRVLYHGPLPEGPWLEARRYFAIQLQDK